MALLALLALSALSTVVPGLPEGTAVVYVEKYHWDRLPVATLCAAGQCLAFAVFYVGGEQLVSRWKRLHREVERVRARFTLHLEERFLGLTALAAVFGIPPAVGMAALGSAFHVPLRSLLSVLFVGRVARFLVLIFFGHQLTAWWHGIWP
jgi:membrane protein YqaA with SNARE-associated domain